VREAPIEQTRAASVEFILDHPGEGFDKFISWLPTCNARVSFCFQNATFRLSY
jgi:hypothetical protein